MSESPPAAPPAQAAGSLPRPILGLVHLSGSRRGTMERLSDEILRVGTARDTEIHLPADREPAVAPHHATLHRRGPTYQLRVEPGQVVRVGGEPVSEMVLASGDVLQLGEGGPKLRFRLLKDPNRPYKTMRQAFDDCVECARAEAGPLAGARTFLRAAVYDLRNHTSPWFRWGFLLLLTFFAVSTVALTRVSLRLGEQLEVEQARLRDLTALFERTQSEALTLNELGEVRAQLDANLSGALERVEALEARAGAGQRVISTAAESVVFLQGSYGFLHKDSRKPLRYVLGDDGTPSGIADQGDGPLLENFFTGTGWVATADGLIVTNRHVAQPWEFDEAARGVVKQGFVPLMHRFVGYLLGIAEPFEVEVVAMSNRADISVLRCGVVTAGTRALALAEKTPELGDEVFVLGYPTGMRALIARTDETFITELMEGRDLDFWAVARKLAAAGHIAPLATRGIVGQVTAAAVVYDAETTSGGSGGPVLDLSGRVVAVNTAILPEFGGSNLGVPVAAVRELLAGIPEPATIEPVTAPEFPDVPAAADIEP